jgi:hypothetical protein
MRELAVHETDDEFVRLWRPDRDERALFVTHLTSDSATRYQFDLIDAEAGRCVYTKGDGITPPRIVVELLNENDFDVTNLPNITETDPAVRANHIIDAIQWLQKHGGFEPGDLRTFAYQRAQNVLVVVYGSHLVMEVIGPDRYAEALDALLDDASWSGRPITAEELRDPRTHDIEFLQTLLVELRRSLPMDDQRAVANLAEERLGITADPDADEDERTKTWESSTTEESTIQFHPDAVATLVEEGWLEDGAFS